MENVAFDLSQFGTDKEKELNGVWQNITKHARVKVARYNNPKYRVALALALKPHQSVLRLGGKVADDLEETLLIEVMAETILLDWENIADKGVILKYSKENAILMMTKYPDFRDLIGNIATSSDCFKGGEEEIAGK